MSRLEPGDVFAGYTIERQLGAGGMGEVYLARHPRLPRHDALKILAAPLADDDHFRARFEREADLVSGLRHPSIVGVYDRGETDGRLWIAFQYIDGPDLAAVAHRGPMPLEQIDQVISQVADALDDAGARGLVHRDVKPANILIDEKGRALLTDFGIAHGRDEANQLTGTGVTIGTVAYSSPEQLQAQPVDARSDQYSLACTAFMLLTGTVPYDAPTPTAIILAHVRDQIPAVTARRPGLPPALDAVFARALAKEPAGRYPSSRDFAAALHDALQSPMPVAPAPVASAPSPQYAPTQLNAAATGPSPRRKTVAYTVIAIAVVGLLIVAGTALALVKYSGGDDGSTTASPSWITASDDAGNLTKDPVGPTMPSLEKQPKEALWSFSRPGTSSYVSAQVVGGTEKYALIADREYAGGQFTAVLYVVDAATGKRVRTVRFPGSDNDIRRCENLRTENRLVCQVSDGTGSSGSDRYAVVDVATGATDQFTARGDFLRVTGDTTWVGSSSGDFADFTAYDITGRKLWSTGTATSPLPPSGSPVVAETQGTVFGLRDITTGKTVYTRDGSKAIDPEQAVKVRWAPFRGGFAVQVGDYNDYRVELYDASGKRTAVAPKGWRVVDYASTGGMTATPLPVLTNEQNDQTATFDPATGKPAVTVRLESYAGQIEGAVGTQVVLSYQSPSTSSSTGGSDGYAYAWFDAYAATGGHFSATVPKILGSDGSNLLVSSQTTVYAYAPDTSYQSWFLSLKNEYGLIAAGGRLYDGNRRLI